MWILKKQNSDVRFYLCQRKSKYTVGRFNCDFDIANDSSISRSHSILNIFADYIEVIDQGSKYGTYCNDGIEKAVGLIKEIPYKIKEGDRVRFGQLDNLWILSKIPICVYSSALNPRERMQLQKIMQGLGGKIVDSYIEQCTHLTMSEISLTVKVLQALIANIPLVSLEFWRKTLSEAMHGRSMPNPDEFLPKISEDIINKELISFQPAKERKTIFSGKTFIFLSKTHFDDYTEIVTAAGGISKNLKQGVTKQLLKDKNTLVVYYSSSSQSQHFNNTINDVIDFVQSEGKRTIPDFEIGLAILTCSLDKYCNPEHKILCNLLPDSKPILPTPAIIASHTPSEELQATRPPSFDSVEIPETSTATSETFTLKDKSPTSILSIEKPLEIEESDDDQLLSSLIAGEGEIKNQTLKRKITPESETGSELKKTKRTVVKEPKDNKRANENVVQKIVKKLKSADKPVPVPTRRSRRTKKNDVSANLESECSEEAHQSPVPSPPAGEKPKSVPHPRASPISESLRKHVPSNPVIPAALLTPVMQSQSQNRLINISEFKEKSQITRAPSPKPVASSSSTDDGNQAQKRPRVALLEDENDNDLFDFGSNIQKKRQKQQKNIENENADDLFNFTNSQLRDRQANKEKSDKNSSTNAAAVIKISPASTSKSSSSVSLSRRSKTISISGWLDKFSLQVKKEQLEEFELKNEEDVPIFTCGFIVSEKQMDLAGLEFNNLSLDDGQESSVRPSRQIDTASSSKVKNFKAFVKKRNFNPQTEIVQTYSYVCT